MALVRLEANPASAGGGNGLGSQTHIATYDDLDLAIAQCSAGGSIAGVDVSTTNLAVQTTLTAAEVLAFANVTAVVATFSS
jgi:hypothetical protein